MKTSALYRWILPSLLLVILFAVNLLTGTTNLRLLPPHTAYYILTEIRLPECLLALTAGIGLSIGGCTTQCTLVNKLADPGIVGINAGASLGCGLVMMFPQWITLANLSPSATFTILTMPAAFMGAIAVTALLLACSRTVQNRTTMLLIGVMLNFIICSIISILTFISTANGIQSYAYWNLGSLSGATLPVAVAALTCTLGIAAVVYFFRRPLNALLLGDSHAQALGYNLRATHSWLLLCVSLLTAITVSICGPIAFIGLTVPHLARTLYHTADHRILIPACALIGPITLLCINSLSHIPMWLNLGGVLPINVLTPLLGGPVVLYILLKDAR